jgi:hypothetical protein
LGDYSCLEYRLASGVLVVRPLPRVLGPWDGSDPPPAEVVEFRDQLRQLLGAEGGPLLLDLSGYGSARNWTWLVSLARECSDRGRSLALWVQPAAAKQLAVTKTDRLVPVRASFAEAMAALGWSEQAGSDGAPDTVTGT